MKIFQINWFHMLFILAIIMILFLWYKKQDLSKYYEGFVQDSPYIFKNGPSINDDFYAEIYNKLMLTKERSSFEIEKIVEMTAPSEKSTFLDIGSGTGELPGLLTQKGFDVYAIDISKDMINYVEKHHPDVQTKCGNAKHAITYEKGSFSHITITGLSFYLFENKDELLRNCFYWLRPGGYLIVHLVDPEKFDTIIPCGKPDLLKNPQQYSSKRITDTNIDFIDFQYKGSYDFSKKNENKVLLKETFTDELTKHVRQQETNFYMEPMNVVLQLASKTGFIPKGQVSMEPFSHDKYQQLVIFERAQ